MATARSRYHGDCHQPGWRMAQRNAVSPAPEPPDGTRQRDAPTNPGCRFACRPILSRRRPAANCSGRYRGIRTLLVVPMLKESELIGQSPSTAGRCGHSPTSRSSSSAILRPGRHRDREHAPARASCVNHCSSRPPPPMCSRSSAARPSTCRRCSTHWSSRRRGCARRIWLDHLRPRG